MAARSLNKISRRNAETLSLKAALSAPPRRGNNSAETILMFIMG